MGLQVSSHMDIQIPKENDLWPFRKPLLLYESDYSVWGMENPALVLRSRLEVPGQHYGNRCSCTLQHIELHDEEEES